MFRDAQNFKEKRDNLIKDDNDKAKKTASRGVNENKINIKDLERRLLTERKKSKKFKQEIAEIEEEERKKRKRM